MVSRYLLQSKMSKRHLVHGKRFLKFGPNQIMWHGTNMLMDVLDRSKYEGCFGVEQMSYGHFGQDQVSCGVKLYHFSVIVTSPATSLIGRSTKVGFCVHRNVSNASLITECWQT